MLVLIIYLLTRLLVYLFARKRVPVRPFCYTAVVLVFACWVLIAYGYWVGRYQVEVKPATYTHPMLPAAFDGYKIVHISDLHLATFADRPAALQRIVDAINTQTPDLICITGDIVTIGVEEALPYTAILQQLHARDAVLSVLGNHDLMIYRDIPTAERLRQVNRLVAFEQDSLRWRVLRDTSFTIVRPRLSAASDLPAMDTLTILGVDNCSCEGQGFRSIYHGDLSAAMLNTCGFRILLSHDPTHWRAEVQDRTNIPLTLSGHTHSGQFRIFGHPLAGLLFQESAGWYYHPACEKTDAEKQQTDEKRQALYINSGVGCTLPVRVNCPAEITIITLYNEI
ncbi:MAG: metallophosphoesterase [Paludibacteraceae bacterium]